MMDMDMDKNDVDVTRQGNAVIHFWKPEEKYGWLSNWSKHAIQQEGICYPTLEHYLMYHKAQLMGDQASANKILAAKKPQDVKLSGRKVMNFDESLWIRHRQSIMQKGLELKIAQHPLLKNLLITTCGKYLAEASPYDTIWGIGCSADDDHAQDPQFWQGLNLLGKAWMNTREKLMLRMLLA